MHNLDKKRQDLIKDNVGLAYFFANKHSQWEQGNLMSLEDRQSEALLALTEAARTWDEGKAPFPAYAAKTIKNKLIQATRNEAQPFNLSWKAHTILRDMGRAVTDGVDDTPDAIAEHLQININKINELWAYHKGARVPMTEVIAETIQASTDIAADVESEIEKDIVRYAVSTLPPTHRKIVRYRFGFETGQPMLSNEIRKEMGLGKTQYANMEAAALRALHSLLKDLRNE